MCRSCPTNGATVPPPSPRLSCAKFFLVGSRSELRIASIGLMPVGFFEKTFSVRLLGRKVWIAWLPRLSMPRGRPVMVELMSWPAFSSRPRNPPPPPPLLVFLTGEPPPDPPYAPAHPPPPDDPPPPLEPYADPQSVN
jgi:hypothetical protein